MALFCFRWYQPLKAILRDYIQHQNWILAWNSFPVFCSAFGRGFDPTASELHVERSASTRSLINRRAHFGLATVLQTNRETSQEPPGTSVLSNSRGCCLVRTADSIDGLKWVIQDLRHSVAVNLADFKPTMFLEAGVTCHCTAAGSSYEDFRLPLEELPRSSFPLEAMFRMKG